MTNIVFNVDADKNIFFDALYHSGEHDTCTIVSSISNVLTAAALRAGHQPVIYEAGHVRIEIPEAKPETIEVFLAAEDCFRSLEKDRPQYVKIF